MSNVDKHIRDGETKVRLCNYTDVYYNRIIHAGPEYMPSTASSEQIRSFRLNAGDTVITKDSETAEDIGVSSYVHPTAPELVCGYHLAILRPGSELEPRFFNWSMKASPARAHLARAATGMTRMGLTYDAIRQTPIPLPPLGQQRRIADFLDDQVSRIDRIIAARRKQIRCSASHYDSWLSHVIDDLQTTQGAVNLRRFVTSIEQGWSPLASSKPAAEGRPGVIKLGAVRSGDFRPQENKELLPETRPDPRYRLWEGDLLVTRANTPHLVGDAAVVRSVPFDSALYLSDLVYRIHVSADPHFISASLRTQRVRRELQVLARGTSQSMVKLRGEDISGLVVPAANRTSQRDIAFRDAQARADRDALTTSLNHSIALLTEYKQSLITAAVTGELDVSTASDRGAPA